MGFGDWLWLSLRSLNRTARDWGSEPYIYRLGFAQVSASIEFSRVLALASVIHQLVGTCHRGWRGPIKIWGRVPLSNQICSCVGMISAVDFLLCVLHYTKPCVVSFLFPFRWCWEILWYAIFGYCTTAVLGFLTNDNPESLGF